MRKARVSFRSSQGDIGLFNKSHMAYFPRRANLNEGVSTMTRNALLVGIAGIVASAVTVAFGDAVATSPEMITFRAVDADDGPCLQIEVGGLIMQTEQFTMLHEGDASTTVTAAGGCVEVRGSNGNRLRAETISTALRGGLFDFAESSRRNVEEEAGTLIESLLQE
jgi:hypothetical protein